MTPSPASPDLLGKTGFPSLLQIHPGTGCSEGFYHLRFLTILPGVAEVKPGSKPRENKGNIYLLCSEAAVPHTHQHPVLTCRSQLLPQPLPPCPQSQRSPSSSPLLPRLPLLNHLAITSIASWAQPLASRGLGHPWVPVPLDLGAWKGGRNVLVVSTTLPANKRSKLGGAEPAGGIWQLTCHFVRHWSKLISLAESP